MTPEVKVLAKMRAILLADSTIISYTTDRIYTSHISSVNNPAYPAISLLLLPGGARFAEQGMVNISIQVDTWLLSTEQTVNDLLVIFERIRTLLHKQSLNDSDLSLVSMQSIEQRAGPVMYENETQLLHFPAIYGVVAI